MKKGKKEITSRKSIMVVDDDESMRMLIGSCFDNEYEITFHTNGVEAMRHIRDISLPDMILLDMEMPDMNGRVFLRRLKYMPQYKDIPVIFISSVNSESIISSMMRLGVQDYVVKPFNRQELIDKVKKILDPQEYSRAS